jgi:hypothetical protein
VYWRSPLAKDVEALVFDPRDGWRLAALFPRSPGATAAAAPGHANQVTVTALEG